MQFEGKDFLYFYLPHTLSISFTLKIQITGNTIKIPIVPKTACSIDTLAKELMNANTDKAHAPAAPKRNLLQCLLLHDAAIKQTTMTNKDTTKNAGEEINASISKIPVIKHRPLASMLNKIFFY